MFFGHARVGVAELCGNDDMVALFAACGIANAQSPVTSKSDRFGRFVAEATPRFGIPAFWITAVMQPESRGAGHPSGDRFDADRAADVGLRYGLGTNLLIRTKTSS